MRTSQRRQIALLPKTSPCHIHAALQAVCPFAVSAFVQRGSNMFEKHTIGQTDSRALCVLISRLISCCGITVTSCCDIAEAESAHISCPYLCIQYYCFPVQCVSTGIHDTCFAAHVQCASAGIHDMCFAAHVQCASSGIHDMCFAVHVQCASSGIRDVCFAVHV